MPVLYTGIFLGDVSTLKRKPEAEVKVKVEPVEPPVHKKIKTDAEASALPPPAPEEKKNEKKKKKAKSYFDDL